MHIRIRPVPLVLLLLTLLLFTLATVPNRQASANLAMVSMLEPDEGVVIPVMQRMISGGANLKETLGRFVLYEYYYYGLPFFGLGALLMLILRGLGLEGNFPLVMLVLRQTLSVLPTLAGILVLVYIQDQFKSRRSIAVFLFLALIPATFRNALWLHPDGLVLLFASLVLYLLWKDDLNLGKYFFWAAFFCGVLTATKLVGLYFFLAVLVVLGLSIKQGRSSWQKALRAAFGFLGIMSITFLLANTFLLSSYGREHYLSILRGQTLWLDKGYGVLYPKGLQASAPVVRDNYGSYALILLGFASSLYGLVKPESRLSSSLIIAWALPLSLSVFLLTHFKYQYWLPVALPLFSTLHQFLPEKGQSKPAGRSIPYLLSTGLALLLIVQGLSFAAKDLQIAKERSAALQSNPAIAFYEESLQRLHDLRLKNLKIYYDYRLYMPATGNWEASTRFDLMDYKYLEGENFDVLMLSAQRVADYLQPGLEGVDPEAFEKSQAFYKDAETGKIRGFHQLYRDETGLLFISKELCEAEFPQENCVP